MARTLLGRVRELGVTALIIAGCNASAEPADVHDDSISSVVQEPIIGGTTATAFPEAALVNMYRGGVLTAACSGAVIAPKAVLTAGHCVDTFNGWTIVAPYADGQVAHAIAAVTNDWRTLGTSVDPTKHDIGLIFLDSPIDLPHYPALATSPVASGTAVVNIGRKQNGRLSNSSLFVSPPLSVQSGSIVGFPFDYVAADAIEPGDSGGPDELPGTSPHVIVAVNSGAGGTVEVLARVDLLAAWVDTELASHGAGSGGGAPPPPSGGSDTPPEGSASTPPPTPGGGTPPPAPSAGGFPAAEEACVNQMNQFRASVGVPPYKRWTSAEHCVDDEARSDGQSGRPHGAFGGCGESVQTECPNWPGPPDQMIARCLSAMWAAGPGEGHYEAIRSARSTEVACGFYVAPNGAVWATQDYR